MSNFSFIPSNKVASFGATVWHEFSPLAVKHNAINLGQGFPDWDGPDFVLKAAHEAVDSNLNQYTRSGGHPRLVNAISKLYSPLFGRTINPMEEVVTTVGASQGIFASVLSFISPGDEVILIEPFFDIYMGSVVMSGAVPKYIALRPKNPIVPGEPQSSTEWVLDLDELKSLITHKTRLLIINTPHNPTGKVFTQKELEDIAEIVRPYPHLVVLSDEVYEWMTYDDAVHFRFATIPGMWERTLTLGSAGKMFSVTGWKIGWGIGPKPLVEAVMKAHQYIPFSISTPMQEAVAVALELAPQKDYFSYLKKMYQEKRDFLLRTLLDAGLTPVVPQGAYFIFADTRAIELKGDDGKNKTITGMNMHRRDWNVCRWLTTEIGVAAIPPSPFYSEEHSNLPENFARFCFCKTDPVLKEAKVRLEKIKSSTNFHPVK
eukprot:TRINITY_DN7335_c0_g1_i1.p1 TRINITY_DN7335_c0_g1~~TRINITY_DN7335_c0_g1_i1.p1  ORF type:complete len:485 (-),score=96.92 TRINITY_DN7335_c0_g1_i1:157-1449(-)